MRNERWFISYRNTTRDFIDGDMLQYDYGSIVTDVSPARWLMYRMMGSGMEHHIIYAEQISLAMASELIHSGTYIKADYYKESE